MAVFKVEYAMADGRMGSVFVADDDEELTQDQIHQHLPFPKIGAVQQVDMRGITGAKEDGSPADDDTLIVQGEDGEWVTYYLLQRGLVDVYGTASDHERLIEAGVDSGYQQVADEVATRDAVDLTVSRAVLDTIRLALDGEHSRLIYLRDKSHSRLAMRALRDEIDAVGTALSAIEGALADEADFR